MEMRAPRQADPSHKFDLPRKFAEFGKLGKNPEGLKAIPVIVTEPISLLAFVMSFQLIRQKVGNIYSYRAIKARMRYPGGTVVVRNGLDGYVGQAPQSQQVGADLRVRCAEQLLFHFKQPASALCGEGVRRTELIGHSAGQDQAADIMK